MKTKRAIKVKLKAFLIIFKGIPDAKITSDLTVRLESKSLINIGFSDFNDMEFCCF